MTSTTRQTASAVDFALCAEPARDALVRPLVERSIDYLLGEVGLDRLHAVILTGSLSRAEGSVLPRPRGTGFRLLGDVEFMVVLRGPIDWSQTRRRMLELSRRATAELGDGGRIANIEYGPTGMHYLRRSIHPCIFAYDLITHGKVVAGRRDILSEVRPFGVEEIPASNAIELVMNRMVELLLLEERTVGQVEDTEARAYHVAKTTLDLAGSALAFAHRYVSSYAARQAPFGLLLDTAPDLRTALGDGPRFTAELERASCCKLAPTDTLLRDHDHNRADRMAAVAGWAKGVWLWEMRRLLGRPSAPFAELVQGYVRHQAMPDRLKGWAKLYLHPLRPSRAFSPWRTARFLLWTSPRALTYAAALIAYWAKTGEGGPEWSKRAAALLPVRRTAGVNGLTHTELGALWRWLVRND